VPAFNTRDASRETALAGRRRHSSHLPGCGRCRCQERDGQTDLAGKTSLTRPDLSQSRSAPTPVFQALAAHSSSSAPEVAGLTAGGLAAEHRSPAAATQIRKMLVGGKSLVFRPCRAGSVEGVCGSRAPGAGAGAGARPRWVGPRNAAMGKGVNGGEDRVES
jgi:hypothetical protein